MSPLVEYIELGELVDAHYFASDGESCWYISDARNTGCTLWTFDLDTREADSVRFVFTDPETASCRTPATSAAVRHGKRPCRLRELGGFAA